MCFSRGGEFSNPAIALGNEVYGDISDNENACFLERKPKMKASKRDSLHGVVEAALKECLVFSCLSGICCGHYLITCSVPVALSCLHRNASLSLPFPYLPP